MTPPFFTASFSRASAAVVPWVPQTSRPISSRMRATLSPMAGGRRQGEIHDAEGRVQPTAGLLGHQLAHAGHPESGLLHGLRHHVKGLALHRFQGSTHHAGAGDAHVDDLLRLSHAVESAGHKGVVLHGIAEHHQLGAAEAIPVRRGGSGIL